MNQLTSIVGSWEGFFSHIFVDYEVIENLNLLNRLYKFRTEQIYPKQENVFKAFQECAYKDVMVVILAQDPYHNGMATGLALANNSYPLSPSLQTIKDTISRTIYKGHDFDFDPTLISWAQQGILLLNTSLTVEQGKPMSHKLLWERFTQQTLIRLSYTNTNLIYCLWGSFAKEYAKFINSFTNTVLIDTHPMYAHYKGIMWDCNHFVLINEKLKALYNTKIEW